MNMTNDALQAEAAAGNKEPPSTRPSKRSPFDFDPENPIISIVVSPDTNNITVVPTSVRLRRGKKLSWDVWVEQGGEAKPAPRAAFLLSFRDAGALGHSEIRSGSAELEDLKAERPGRYNYKVMAAVEERIYADVGCPSMIIRN